MDDKALREEVLRRETVYPGKIIRVEQWQVTFTQRGNGAAGNRMPYWRCCRDCP